VRPSRRLFDGTAQLWRGAEARSTWGGVERSYTAVGDPFPCAVQVARRNRGNLGPGEAEVGQWMVYAPIDAEPVESGDVVQVLTGPEAGRTVRVDDPYRPRGRFQQVECRQWDGVLP